MPAVSRRDQSCVFVMEKFSLSDEHSICEPGRGKISPHAICDPNVYTMCVKQVGAWMTVYNENWFKADEVILIF